MTRSTEKSPKRFLRVTEKHNSSLVSRANSLLHTVGMNGFTDSTSDRVPLSVDIPRNFGLRKGLRFGEARKVARAMSELGSIDSRQGTKIRGGDWKVEDVRIDRKGRVHVKKLRRWTGWQLPVQISHRLQIADARHDMPFATKTDVVSTVMRKNPIRQALAKENQEARALQSVDKSATVNGWQSGRARFVAKLAEANPLRAAKKFLQVGQSRNIIYGQLHSMMLQVADVQLDPTDRIHGPFEEGVKILQRFQRGLGGAVLTSIAGDLPIFNRLTSLMIDGNKIASRDTRAEMSPRGLLRVARRLLVIDRYGNFYGWAATRKKSGWLNRLLLPADSLVEQAADRRMQRGNIAKLAKTEAIIRGNDWRMPLQRVHQRVVAQEFVKAYNAPAPLLEVFTHAGFGRINAAGGKATGLGKGIIERAEKILPPFMRGKKAETTASQDSRTALKAAIEAYGGRPMSIKQQVDVLLAHVDGVLAAPLRPIERVRWTIAKMYASRFAALNEDALIASGLETSRRTSAEESTTPPTPVQ